MIIISNREISAEEGQNEVKTLGVTTEQMPLYSKYKEVATG